MALVWTPFSMSEGQAGGQSSASVYPWTAVCQSLTTIAPFISVSTLALQHTGRKLRHITYATQVREDKIMVKGFGAESFLVCHSLCFENYPQKQIFFKQVHFFLIHIHDTSSEVKDSCSTILQQKDKNTTRLHYMQNTREEESAGKHKRNRTTFSVTDKSG